MKNSIEEDIELLQEETSSLGLFFKCKGSEKYKIALEHILSDYKKVLKETENNFISKQIVKDNLIKYQEEYELLLEHQSGKESNRTKYLRGRIHMCQELLESEE